MTKSESVPSYSETFNACTVPAGLDAPFRIEKGSVLNNLVIGWTQPSDNGGCPITGYSVFRDDAQGGDVTTEVNTVNDPTILTNPVLRSFTITNFEPSSDFMIYRVSVRAHNREGYFDSPYLRIMNAGNPLALDTGITLYDKNQTSIHVEMPLVAEDDTTLSYEL